MNSIYLPVSVNVDMCICIAFWTTVMRFYGPNLLTNPQGIVLEHNDIMKRLEELCARGRAPRVGEGWTRLCQALEV